MPSPSRFCLRRLLAITLLVLVSASAFATIQLLSTSEGPSHERLQQLAVVAAEPSPEPSTHLPEDLNVSVLHPRIANMEPLKGDRITFVRPVTRGTILETTQFFAQHGRQEPGIQFCLKNRAIQYDDAIMTTDSLLLITVLNDHASYGPDRSSDDFFELIGNFTHPTNQTSLAMLTSSMDEFRTIQHEMRRRIHVYAQFSLVYRSDFTTEGLTRGNRHADELQATRRSMIARYRNFALMSSLETWHQHVVWLDADVHIVPPDLVTKMIRADRDVLEPICLRGSPPSTDEYDLNAWVAGRSRHMHNYRGVPNEFIPLDSVGGTMLYVKADIHRQGVMFPTQYLIGATWENRGHDGIESEGLCFMAHYLGYRCWGMPHDPIYHVG